MVYRSRVASTGGLVRQALPPRESFEMVPFEVVRDGDGERVAIEGRHALLDLPNLPLRRPRAPEQRERRTRFLLAHGLKPKAGGFFEEVVVAPGMRVTVAGLMMKDPTGAPPEGETDYRPGVPVTLRLAGDVAHPLVIGEG